MSVESILFFSLIFKREESHFIGLPFCSSLLFWNFLFHFCFLWQRVSNLEINNFSLCVLACLVLQFFSLCSVISHLQNIFFLLVFYIVILSFHFGGEELEVLGWCCFSYSMFASENLRSRFMIWYHGAVSTIQCCRSTRAQLNIWILVDHSNHCIN